VEHQDRERIRALLGEHADVNLAQPDGMTSLHWAAHLDDMETAKQLVEAGANVKAENRYGVTPLSLACVNGNAEIVGLLLDQGRRSKYEASRRRDRSDDRGAHGKTGVRRGAPRPQGGSECEGAARANRNHVGGG
jgi:ankyrin repeat protein